MSKSTMSPSESVPSESTTTIEIRSGTPGSIVIERVESATPFLAIKVHEPLLPTW